MRIVGAIALAVVLGGCTSVKMVQRDGCWVKRTEKVFGRVREEVGPCSRQQPKWAEDRLTRLVQECVAQADYRWQGRAIDAWSKGKPYPPQPPQDETLRSCLEEARAGLISQNETLKARVDELSADRSTLRRDTDQDKAALRASHDRLIDYLGEAAKKPPAPAYATATATSDGKATNESGATLSSGSTSGSGANAPAGGAGEPTTATAPPKAPVQPAASSKVARARRPVPAAKSPTPPGCDVPAKPASAAGGDAGSPGPVGAPPQPEARAAPPPAQAGAP